MRKKKCGFTPHLSRKDGIRFHIALLRKKGVGFTLIEVMVAVFILVVGIAAVLAVFPLGLQIRSGAEMSAVAAWLAQEKIEEVISMPYSDIPEGTIEARHFLDPPYQKYERETETIVGAETSVIRPSSPGDLSQWTATGCSENWDCVNEDPADGTTTNVGSVVSGAPRQDLYNLQDTSQSGTINSITVYFTAVCTTCGYPSVAAVIKEGGVTTVGNQQMLTSGQFTLYSQAWTTNPRTGSAWQWSEINSLQAGIRDNARSLGAARVTQLYAEVFHSSADPFMKKIKTTVFWKRPFKLTEEKVEIFTLITQK